MEFNGDGEARVECACTAGDPARGLEAAEMKKWTRKDEHITRAWTRISTFGKVWNRTFFDVRKKCGTG